MYMGFVLSYNVVERVLQDRLLAYLMKSFQLHRLHHIVLSVGVSLDGSNRKRPWPTLGCNYKTGLDRLMKTIIILKQSIRSLCLTLWHSGLTFNNLIINYLSQMG